MDDMKRAIYMLALEKISKWEKKWVCLALREAFIEITGYDQWDPPESERIEIFSEFFNLYDARLWYKWGKTIYFESLKTDMADSSWWQFAWREPRMRILNCILCHH